MKCTACSGSGYYDSDGSPPCGSCNGTGQEEESLEDRINELEAKLYNSERRCERLAKDLDEANSKLKGMK